MEVNLKTFLNAAFGEIDAESGYGACYPRSRDIKTFFEARNGPLPTGSCITMDYGAKKEQVQEQWVDAARLLVADLRSIADQLEQAIPQEASHDQRPA